MIQVRRVEPDDMPTLQGWAKRRGCMLEPKLVSPHGFLATHEDEPLLCAWAALMCDVPIVQVDHVYFARRFQPDVMRQAWADLLAAVRAFVREVNAQGFGYSLIEIMMNPVMQAEAERAGGQVSKRSYKRCHYLL